MQRVSTADKPSRCDWVQCHRNRRTAARIVLAVPVTGDELVVVLDLVTVLLDLVRSDDQLEVVVLEERGGHCGTKRKTWQDGARQTGEGRELKIQNGR